MYNWDYVDVSWGVEWQCVVSVLFEYYLFIYTVIDFIIVL